MTARHLPVRQLPVVLPPVADELLSSWIGRHASFYGVAGGRLLRHYALEADSLRELDLKLTSYDERPLAHLLRYDPHVIRNMMQSRRLLDVVLSGFDRFFVPVLPRVQTTRYASASARHPNSRTGRRGPRRQPAPALGRRPAQRRQPPGLEQMIAGRGVSVDHSHGTNTSSTHTMPFDGFSLDERIGGGNELEQPGFALDVVGATSGALRQRS